MNSMNEVTIEKPKEMKAEYVCYWAAKEGILIGDQETKIKAYLTRDCIKKVEGGYDILPIPGTRTVNHIRNGQCGCQWNRTKGLECSHLKAVKIWEFMRRYNEKKS